MLHFPTFTWMPTALTAGLLLALLPTTSAAQPVYRCGNTYSSTPCAGSHALPLAAAGPQHSTRHTPQHGEQREAREWERTERELDKAEAKIAPQRAQGKDRAACQAANRRIQKIDELARKGGSVQKMERLREDRQAARDRQFSAGC